MWPRGWVVLGMLVLPGPASAQAVKKMDVIGAWSAEVEHAADDTIGQGLGTTAWLVLWPDGLWWYGGALMHHEHGGARWRLVGDTLWLANDYEPYFHPMIERRFLAFEAKGYEDLGTMDLDLIRARAPYPVPDSIYWSKAFRDSTTTCVTATICGTWVYQVSMRDKRLYLVRIESLSRATRSVATKAVLTRDSLVGCHAIGGC